MAQQPLFQQPLFGIVPANLSVVTEPAEIPNPTSFLYSIPPGRPFNHVAVFILPGVVLPPGSAAAIYLVTPPAPGSGSLTPKSRLLGGIGPGKESAIFGIKSAASATGPGQEQGQQQQEQPVVIGISLEPADSVAARVTELKQQGASSSSSAAADHPSFPVAPPGASGQQQRGGRPSTLVLAQRIIENAFNFLASFSQSSGQVEYVPLKAFQDWWVKFESRVRTDPGFLERNG